MHIIKRKFASLPFDDFWDETKQLLIDDFTTSDWFMSKVDIILSVFRNYNPETDKMEDIFYQHMMSCAEQGIRVVLPSDEVQDLFKSYSFEQLFYIFFAYWFGIHEDIIDFLKNPVLTDYQMDCVVRLVVHYQLPVSEFHDFFDGINLEDNGEDFEKRYADIKQYNRIIPRR